MADPTVVVRVLGPAELGHPVEVEVEVQCAAATRITSISVGLGCISTLPRGALPPVRPFVRVHERGVLPAGVTVLRATLDLGPAALPAFVLGVYRHQPHVVVELRRPWRGVVRGVVELHLGAPLAAAPTSRAADARDGSFAVALASATVAVGAPLVCTMRLPSPAAEHWTVSAVLVPSLVLAGEVAAADEQPLLPLTLLDQGATELTLTALVPADAAPSVDVGATSLHWRVRLLVQRGVGSQGPMLVDVPVVLVGHQRGEGMAAWDPEVAWIAAPLAAVAVRRGWHTRIAGPSAEARAGVGLVRCHPAGVLGLWFQWKTGGRAFDAGIAWHGDATVPADPRGRSAELLAALSEGASGATSAGGTAAPRGARVHLVTGPVDYRRVERLVYELVALADRVAQRTSASPQPALTWGAFAAELGSQPGLADLAIVGRTGGRTVQTRVRWDTPQAAPYVEIIVGLASEASAVARDATRTAELPGRAVDLLGHLPAGTDHVVFVDGTVRATWALPEGTPLAEAAPVRAVVHALVAVLRQLDDPSAPYR